ncbi:MAG: glycosyltransferase family 4 protein [Micromonosporaceae bacterium]
MRLRYVVLNAYGTGGVARTVVNQANALCANYDVEIASVYRHRERPHCVIDPRVRLVPLTEFHPDGRPRFDPGDGPTRLTRKTRWFRNRMVHGRDQKFRRWDPVVDARLIRYFWAVRDGVLVTARLGVSLLASRYASRRLIRIAQEHLNLATYHPRTQAAITEGYRKLDAVTMLTETDRTSYRNALGDTGVRLECVPNGIPQPSLPAARLDSKIIIAAGRLGPQKGFDMLLDAFATVHERHPDWQLHIFGGGHLRHALAGRIERLGLTGAAHLKGVTRRLDEQLAAASIFVLSSRFEGLPMVLLEAMAAGLPVVSFNCPTGPAEVITDNASGLLVPPEDVPALAAAICELIEDPVRRQALATAARKEVERYSIESVRQRWESLFTELAAERKTSRVRGAE